MVTQPVGLLVQASATGNGNFFYKICDILFKVCTFLSAEGEGHSVVSASTITASSTLSLNSRNARIVGTF